jgi:hypothetical protein
LPTSFRFTSSPVHQLSAIAQRWFRAMMRGMSRLLQPCFLTKLTILIMWCLPREAEAGLAEDILGKWRYHGKQAGATIESVAEFKEDGVYACHMTVGIFGTRSAIHFKGKWRIEEDVHVIIEVTETSSPFFLPKGKVIRKETVEIQAKLMTYRYGGKRERELRVSASADNTASRKAEAPAEK